MSVYRIESLPSYDDESKAIFDIWHLPFEGDDVFDLQYGSPNTKYVFPKTLIAFGNMDNLKKKHYIVTRFTNYTWSKEIVDILLSVSNFEYRFLNIHIFDLELYRWACANNGQPLPDYAEANTDFGYFRLRNPENTLDCFDFDKSEYQPPRRPGGVPRSIKKIVFHNKKFPALFRDKNASGDFISQDAKNALEANGIYLPLTEIEVS